MKDKEKLITSSIEHLNHDLIYYAKSIGEQQLKSPHLDVDNQIEQLTISTFLLDLVEKYKESTKEIKE